MKFNDRTLFTLGVFVLVLLVLALDYQPRARLVPLIIAVPTLLLALFQFLIDAIPTLGRRFSFFGSMTSSASRSAAPPRPPGKPARPAPPSAASGASAPGCCSSRR